MSSETLVFARETLKFRGSVQAVQPWQGKAPRSSESPGPSGIVAPDIVAAPCPVRIQRNSKGRQGVEPVSTEQCQWQHHGQLHGDARVRCPRGAWSLDEFHSTSPLAEHDVLGGAACGHNHRRVCGRVVRTGAVELVGGRWLERGSTGHSMCWEERDWRLYRQDTCSMQGDLRRSFHMHLH